MSPSGSRPRVERAARRPARAPARGAPPRPRATAARKPAGPADRKPGKATRAARAPARGAAPRPRATAARVPARPAPRADRPARTKRAPGAHPARRPGAVPRDSEALYRVLFEYASDGMSVNEIASHRFLEVNPRSCEMLGYTRDELLRMSVPDLIPPEDLAAQPVSVDDLEGGRPVYKRLRLLRKDGSVFDAEIGSRLLPDGRAVSVVRDISQLRQTEQALRNSEARYRALLDYASDGIVVTDVGFSILDVNPRACQMLGFSREELSSLHISDLLPPGELEAHPLESGRLEKESSVLTHRWLRRKDGSVFAAETHAGRLPDGRIVATIRDVTENQRVQQALLQSEARGRALFEHASDGILISDGETHAFEEVNPRACEMFGYTREELLRMTVRQLNDPQEFAERPLRMEVLRTGVPVHGVRRLLRRDGTTLVAEIGTRLLPDGRVMSDRARHHRAGARGPGPARERGQATAPPSNRPPRASRITDRAWRFLDVNPRFCELVGYSREELLRMSVMEIAVREDLHREPLHVEELAREARSSPSGPCAARTARSSPLEISARGLGDGTVLSVVRDITERKRAEQALRESEERFRRVYESDMLGMLFGAARRRGRGRQRLLPAPAGLHARRPARRPAALGRAHAAGVRPARRGDHPAGPRDTSAASPSRPSSSARTAAGCRCCAAPRSSGSGRTSAWPSRWTSPGSGRRRSAWRRASATSSGRRSWPTSAPGRPTSRA